MVAYLEKHVPPEQVAALHETGALPDGVRYHLATELHRELTACAAYIPGYLVRRQLAHPEPGRVSGAFWQGSILFADLSGFTAFCDKLSVLGKQGAEEVTLVINQLFNALVAEVFAYQGELLKFGGDALTAFFHEDKLGTQHASAATRAALAMQSRMAAFASVETRAGSFHLGLRVGVHSGEVFAAEVGNEEHIELVVTGTEVSRVAQAQHMAAPGEVVITEQTLQLLKDAHRLPKQPGFYQVLRVPEVSLPPTEPMSISDEETDLATLEQRACQLAALRPYLVRGLPRRFLESSAAEIGEFRPVSVLFANFYNFSALLPFLKGDADRAATALNAYFRRAQDIVHAYGGIINKVDMYTHGDKLMVLFGAPVAHEDDPLRAVRCGLELVDMLRAANDEIRPLIESGLQEPVESASLLDVANQPVVEQIWQQPLRQRIGINSGTVFAGRLGGKERYEYSVLGPAVNLSSRLMEVSREDIVLLSPATRQTVERSIAVVEESPVSLKGLPEPIVPVHALDKENVSTPAVPTTLARPPLMGRDSEMHLLQGESRVALLGEGRVLVVIGEVGVGKTRLIEELIQTLVLSSFSHDPEATAETVPCFMLSTANGQSFKQNVPYLTIRAILIQILGLTSLPEQRIGEADNEQVVSQIQTRVEKLAPELAHFLPLISDVLGVSLPESALTRALSAEQRHGRVQELVIALLVGAARQEPLLLLIDDLQWVDASSRDILAQVTEVAQNVPLLLLFSYRANTTISEPWLNLPIARQVVLQELSTEQSKELLHTMLDGPPSEDILSLLDRTQGNPFFIEELVRALVDSGTLVQDKQGHWRLTKPLDKLVIPTNIEGLIMERLDRLEEPFHQLVQVASVIGPRFQYDILQGVYPETELLQEGLRYLQDMDIVGVEEKPHEVLYYFRHALLHNVAYEGILYAHRRELHRRVALRIESLSTGQMDENLNVLARHYLLAEEWEPAFRYHMAAGVQAQKRYANQEALELFATALEIGERLETTPVEKEADALKEAGTTTDERRASMSDRRQRMAPQKQTFSGREPKVWDGRQWLIDRRKGPEERRQNRDSYQNHGPQPAESASTCPLSPFTIEMAELYEHSGDIYMLMGQYDQSHAAYQQALELITQWKQEQDASITTSANTHHHDDMFGNRQKVATMMVRLHRLLASVEEYRADYDKAFTWIEDGLKYATSNTRGEFARCYLLGASIYQRRGEFDQSLEWARLGLSIAQEQGNTADQAYALLLMGNLWRDQGGFEQSIASLEEARSLLDQMKDATHLGDALTSLGDVYWSTGRWQDALKCYQQSLQISENIGDVMGQASTSNKLATVMVGRGELAMALHLYQYSSEQFKRIGSLLGLATTGYQQGEVMLHEGKPREAMHLFRVSMSSLERIKARNSLSEVYRLAAEAMLMLEDTKEATEYIDQSLMIAHDLGMIGEEAIGWRVMGQIALAEQDFDAAREYLTDSRQSLEKLKNRYELGKVLYWQAKLACAEGQISEALSLAQHAEEIFKDLRAKRDLKLVQALITTIQDNGEQKSKSVG
jgi:class 3 adenylate cyclase/predicted ATPase